jgi:hypothetical protein
MSEEAVYNGQVVKRQERSAAPKKKRGRPRKNPPPEPSEQDPKPSEAKEVKEPEVKQAKEPEAAPPEAKEDGIQQLLDKRDQIPVEQIRRNAQQTEMIESHLPADMSDTRAERRSSPTWREVEDEEADRKLTGFEDIMARYPIGDGQYYIQVTRKKPTQYQGFRCDGRMRDVRKHMTYQDFVEEYGGGQYQLQVYGPPKRGGLLNPHTGKPNPTKQGKEVALTVPWDMSAGGGYPPNPDACQLNLEMEEEEEPMPSVERDAPYRGAFDLTKKRMSTPSDAKMFGEALSVEERRRLRQEEREDREEREERLREERDRKQQEGTYTSMFRSLQNVASETLRQSAEDRRYEREEYARREEQLREEARVREEQARREAERARRDAEEREARMREQGTKVEDLAKLLEIAKPSDQETRTLIESARAEVTRVQEAHSREIERINQAWAKERSDWQQTIQEEKRRSDEKHKELDDRYERRLAEEDRRWQRILDEAKKDGQREREYLDNSYKQQLENERRQHERDLSTREAMHQSQLGAEKSAMAAEITQLKNQLEVERREAERWREEARKAGNLAERIEEFDQIASRIGYTRGEGGGEPDSWKGMLFSTLSQLAPQLPGIVASAGETVTRMRQGPNAQAHAQHREQQMRLLQQSPTQIGDEPLAFATDDNFSNAPALPDFSTPQSMSPPPPQAPFVMPVGESMNEPTIATDPNSASPPPAPQPPQPQMQTTPQVEPQTQPPQPQQSQPQPAQQQSAPSQAVDANVESQIIQFEPALVAAIQGGEQPSTVAQGLMEAVGADVLRQIAHSITPQRVAQVISKHRGDQHMLVTRTGQDWLRALEVEVQMLLE